mmetsp:Transcript_16644/g.42567  ORF Transcript_16644/g.42567 Transcript_16644/m.42567 type:complete len:232 (-) Transcript_16644:258-953(-)
MRRDVKSISITRTSNFSRQRLMSANRRSAKFWGSFMSCSTGQTISSFRLRCLCSFAMVLSTRRCLCLVLLLCPLLSLNRRSFVFTRSSLSRSFSSSLSGDDSKKKCSAAISSLDEPRKHAVEMTFTVLASFHTPRLYSSIITSNDFFAAFSSLSSSMAYMKFCSLRFSPWLRAFLLRFLMSATMWANTDCRSSLSRQRKSLNIIGSPTSGAITFLLRRRMSAFSSALRDAA